MAYATVQELTNAMAPKAPPANAQQLLDRASRDVDQALLCTVYDTALPANVAALKLATLEQVQAGLDNGDRTGTGVTSGGGFTLGRLSVQAPAANATGAPRKVGRLWAPAWDVLQQAGLTGDGPSQPGGQRRTWP
ncbi:hypothetical protein [Dactylosporangium sp. NPDC000521]|uniref:hypothetical protein n=1 Tax=Dactylosporangium sp. NPDC000521 TaxID=3363975 RepID=UPI0036B39A63